MYKPFHLFLVKCDFLNLPMDFKRVKRNVEVKMANLYPLHTFGNAVIEG